MRKKMMLLAVLCLSAAWLMAQAPTSSGAPASNSGQSATQSSPSSQSASPSSQSGAASQSNPDTQSGAASPSNPGAQSGAAGQSAAGSSAAGAASDMSITEGCLGGSNPNYTLTDKKGTTYKLVTPPDADVSVLSRHIGEPIAVMGTVNGAGASGSASSGSVASGAGASAGSSNQPSIQVTKIGRGSGDCPAKSGAASPKSPQSK